jgi:hypothetical protein
MQPVVKSTLALAIKRRLRFSYKKCSQRPLPVSTQETRQQHKEAAVIIAALRRCKIPICYIDEYNASDQDFRLYSWLPKGTEDYLLNQQRREPLHIIAAVTDQ